MQLTSEVIDTDKIIVIIAAERRLGYAFKTYSKSAYRKNKSNC